MRSPRRGAPARLGGAAYRPPRHLPTAVIPLVVAVAVLGYVAGHSGSDGSSGGGGPTAESAHVLIEYPPGWKAVSGKASIPGLTIVHPRLISAGKPSARAGLIVGTMPAGELGPLPKSFVSRLQRLPQIAVVNLVEGQAYRYARFSGRGLDEPLTIFVIPNPGAEPTALACYAPSQASRDMLACEQAVSGVTIVGQPQVFQLTPEPGYATSVSTAIGALDRVRTSLKHELRPQVSAERAQQLATKLGEGFAASVEALARVEPAAAAEQVQKALLSAMQRARDGYHALAAAAAERSLTAYTSARKRIADAESDVDWALENFVLIGYSPALQGAARPGS
jgi:hypothetical protein